MNDAAIPAETKETVVPATPPVAPVVPPVAAPVPPVPAPVVPPTPPAATPAVQPETVTLTKEAHDQLQKDSARASGNQRKADLYDRTNNGGKGHFKSAPAPAQAPTPEEQNASAAAEDSKAERGILAIAADPAYREVLDADPTLRNLFVQNPMAILPMYANDAVDAEDAIALVKESLDGMKKPAEPAPATPPVVPPVAVPAADGAVPPAPAVPTDEAAYQAAQKNPNTEQALAGMIGAKIRPGG